MTIEAVPISQAFRGGAGSSSFPAHTRPSASFMMARSLPKDKEMPSYVRGGESKGMDAWKMLGYVGALAILGVAVTSWTLLLSMQASDVSTFGNQVWVTILFSAAIATTAMIIFSGPVFDLTNMFGKFVLDTKGCPTMTGIVVHSLVLAIATGGLSWVLVTKLGASKAYSS